MTEATALVASTHQNQLDAAFAWVEFAYKQGDALLKTIRRMLAEEPTPPRVEQLSCYSASRSRKERYVWLDVDWWLPKEPGPEDVGLFAALAYASDSLVGSHLIVGVAHFRAMSPIVTRPRDSAHWMIDFVADPKANPKKLTAELQDGLTLHRAGAALPQEDADNLKHILSAAFPVAWIDEEDRLRQIVAGLMELSKGDSSKLGRLAQEAKTEVPTGV